MRRFTPRYLEMLVEATRLVANACLDLGLECRDPPLASTALLYSMGYSQYEIRSLWARLSTTNPLGALVYKFGNALFNIELEHEIEKIHSIDYKGYRVPVDSLDTIRLRRGRRCCEVSPRTHTVRGYIRGSLSEHVNVGVNVVRMLVLIGESLGRGFIDELLDSLLEVIWRNRLEDLERRLSIFFSQHRYAKVLKIILPYVPESEEGLLRVSPILRRLTLKLERTPRLHR